MRGAAKYDVDSVRVRDMEGAQGAGVRELLDFGPVVVVLLGWGESVTRDDHAPAYMVAGGGFGQGWGGVPVHLYDELARPYLPGSLKGNTEEAVDGGAGFDAYALMGTRVSCSRSRGCPRQRGVYRDGAIGHRKPRAQAVGTAGCGLDVVMSEQGTRRVLGSRDGRRGRRGRGWYEFGGTGAGSTARVGGDGSRTSWTGPGRRSISSPESPPESKEGSTSTEKVLWRESKAWVWATGGRLACAQTKSF